MRKNKLWRETLLVICENEKSCDQQSSRLFFLHVQVLGNTLTPCLIQSPLTAKLTAKPVDNSGFLWMGVDIRLASGADGRHRRRYNFLVAASAEAFGRGCVGAELPPRHLMC